MIDFAILAVCIVGFIAFNVLYVAIRSDQQQRVKNEKPAAGSR